MKFPTDINGVSSNSRNSILFFSLLPKTLSFSSSPSSPPPNSGDALVSAAVSILKHHRSKSRWSHLRSLLATTKTTPSQFSDISLKLRNNPHLVLRFFHFTLHHSLSSHSLSSYATVVHILSRSRRKSQALDVIKSAMCAFSEAAVAILEALIKTYRACDSAPFVFDLLIIACLESKKIDRAVEIYSVLKSKNVLLKTSTCNSLIELVSKSRGCFAGYDLYRDILDRNEICVEELWEEFIRIGCAPNVYSFNVLMAAYCDGGKLEYVMRVWREMKDKGLNYDVVTYNTVIGGFCRAGEVLRAEEIYGEMVMKGVESTCITFEHLINGYCKIGGHDSAMMVYMDMCRKNFNPESSTVNVMIRSLCDKDEISTAIEFWRLAVKRNGAVLEKGNYLNLIRGLCRDGNMEEALKLQAEMAVRGFEPDSEIYDAFIDGYVKDGNEMMASKLRKEMICKRTTSLL
ncbi:pentatricopeptide repeat-containing protein at2g15980 [Phtheirospermum japonicum]|uniref:Pentatricopeptide repeat-containing protein at2g15980 n=1 Tax=Phtheirospermum japonicum TaxID=374723 RepID=A0A830BE73_9LAMI|nr:pentatricopeptide repeat-containing protein at2g15980 [Phtheirospermum japonicum]